jgi:hypothetical protein
MSIFQYDKFLTVILSVVLFTSFVPFSYSEDASDIFDDLDNNPESVDYFVENGFKIYTIHDSYGDYYIPYIANGQINSMNYTEDIGAELLIKLSNPISNFYIIIPSFLFVNNPGYDEYLVIEYGDQYLQKSQTNNMFFVGLALDFPVNMIKLIHSVLITHINADPFLPYYEKTTNSIFFDIHPPKKQIKNNIPMEEILCDDNLHLIKKQHGDSPACVFSTTKDILLEREGWLLVW